MVSDPLRASEYVSVLVLRVHHVMGCIRYQHHDILLNRPENAVR